MDIRDLTGEHAPALWTFDCRNFKQSWTAEIQRVIREQLTSSLVAGEVSGIGGWVGAELVAVSAWATDDQRWTSVLLAVANGHRKRGYARALKISMLDRARKAGATSVVSFVHRDNEAMCALNESLGGRCTLDPGFPRNDYLIYEIRL